MDDKLYLENLDEEILQLNKVVTYKWLVHTLKVPTNVAKQMLFEFVENQKLAGVDLKTTYFVSGMKQINGVLGHEVCVVPGSKLEATKASFSTLTSVHLYSVSKAELNDVGDLYAVDHEISDICVKLYAISCDAATVRDEKLRQELKPTTADSITACKKKVEQPTVKQETKETLPASKNSEKSPPDTKKTKQTKNSAIASMFQNMEGSKSSKSSSFKTKSENLDTAKESAVKVETASKSAPAKTDKKSPAGGSKKQPTKNGGIATMFKSMASRESSKPSTVNANVEGRKNSAGTDNSVKSDNVDKMDVEEGKAAKTSRKNATEEKSGDKNRTKATSQVTAKRKATAELADKRKRRNVASEDNQKRRKRIIAVSDSSEEDEERADSVSESPVPSPQSRRRVIEESSEDEDPIPPTQAPPVRAATTVGRRKRKLVAHTVLDEEGYMVTQNRYEHASASDEGSADENEEPTGTGNAPLKAKGSPVADKPVKTEPVVVKNKQATMMNFFKKK